MFIDIHAHAYRYQEKFVCGFCNPEQLIQKWDELGIAKGVVQPIVSPEVYFPQSNEDILDMAEKYPDRIIPFCNIDPRALCNMPNSDFGPVMEYYKERGCKGIGEVMCNLHIMDPRMQNLFHHAEKAGFSVTIDGAVMLDNGFGVYDDPGLPGYEYTLLSYPELVVFGHGPVFWSEIAKLDSPAQRGYIYKQFGGRTGGLGEGPIKEEGQAVRMLRKYPNLYGDLSDGTPFYMLNRDPDFGAALLTEFQDKMFFGTDIVSPKMPVPIIGLLNDWLAEGRLSQEVYDKITFKNAEKFLGL